MLLVDTKHDGLSEAVSLLEKVSQMSGHRLRPGTKGNATFKIRGLVFLIGNGATVSVKIILARPPSGGIPLCNDTVHAIRRKKPVINALLETISVKRVSKIKIGIAILLPEWRSRHTQLIPRLKILKNVTPVT